MKNRLNTVIGQSELTHPTVPPAARYQAMRAVICWFAALASAMGVATAADNPNALTYFLIFDF